MLVRRKSHAHAAGGDHFDAPRPRRPEPHVRGAGIDGLGANREAPAKR
jgi:hypothetical protein